MNMGLQDVAFKVLMAECVAYLVSCAVDLSVESCRARCRDDGYFLKSGQPAVEEREDLRDSYDRGYQKGKGRPR